MAILLIQGQTGIVIGVDEEVRVGLEVRQARPQEVEGLEVESDPGVETAIRDLKKLPSPPVSIRTTALHGLLSYSLKMG